MKYKYSVVTSVFGEYEMMHEVKNPCKDVEYILVTNNPELKSSTWTVKVFDKYDKIDFPVLDWIYVKFFPFEFCSCDMCLYVDGSVQINNDFSEMMEYLDKNDCEYAAATDLPWHNIEHWFNGTIGSFQSPETKKHILEYLENNNYDIYESGLIHTAFIYRKNTYFTKKIDSFAWNLLKSYDRGAEGYRENQSSITLSLRKNARCDRRFKVLSQYILLGSRWFTWMDHNSISVRDLYGVKDTFIHDFDIDNIVSFNNKLYKPLTYTDIVKNDPLLTVVITCYNKENTIRRAIESVKKMSYKNWECIIVNNDSFDNSLDIIYETTKGDSRFKIISQTNRNLCNSRNIGAFAGKGKYLVHLDGDDEIGEYFCENSILEMEANDDICISTGVIKRVYLNGISENILSAAAWLKTSEPSLFKNIMDTELHYNVFPVTCVIRMNRFKEIGGFREGAEHTVEDWEMFLRYFDNNTDSLGVYYLYDGQSVIMYETLHSKTKEQTPNWRNTPALLEEVKALNLDIFKKYNL